MSDVQCPNCGHVFDAGVDPDWADRMRRMREGKRITLRRLADRLGFSPAYISDIERCRRNKPRPEIVRAWESYLEQTA